MGDARKPEVEARDLVPERLAPGQDEASQTGIDVKTGVVFECEIGEIGDRVDGAVTVVAGGTDQRDGARRDVIADEIDVDQCSLRIDWSLDHLEPE